MAYKKNSYSKNYQSNKSTNSGQKKHTGSKTGIVSKGNNIGSPYTIGWNYSRKHGLVKFFAGVTKGTHTTTSKTGRDWLNVMVKVQKPFAEPVLISGLMERVTGKVIIKDWNWVINPKAPNGGYCGKIS